MGNLVDFLKNRKNRSSFGPRTNFYSKVAGTNTVRAFTFKNGAGEEVPCFQFFSHRLGIKNQIVCPKTFDETAECGYCDQSRLLVVRGEQETGRQTMAKQSTWFAVVNRNSQDEKIEILELPYGVTETIWTNIALKGGWTSPENDWESEDFTNALQKGMSLVYGEKGYDLSFYYTPRGGLNTYSKVAVSSRPGKKVTVEEIPDIEDIFYRVKKLDKDGNQKPVTPEAPPPDFNSMSKKDLMAYAEKVNVKASPKDSKAKIIEALS